MAELTDVSPVRRCARSGYMEEPPVVAVLIEFDQRDPPVGQLTAKGGGVQRFSGWLGLLRRLSEIVERGDASSGSR